MKSDWRKRKKRNAIMKHYGIKSFEAYKYYVKYMARLKFMLDKSNKTVQRHTRNAISNVDNETLEGLRLIKELGDINEEAESAIQNTQRNET